MTMNSKIIPIVAVALITCTCAACSIDSRQRAINRAVKEYVTSTLAPDEKYEFVGIFNPHDTVVFGVTRPYAGVIYTVEDASTGESTRCCVDVVFTDGYDSVISVTESEIDPIAMAKRKLKKSIKESLLK